MRNCEILLFIQYLKNYIPCGLDCMSVEFVAAVLPHQAVSGDTCRHIRLLNTIFHLPQFYGLHFMGILAWETSFSWKKRFS